MEKIGKSARLLITEENKSAGSFNGGEMEPLGAEL